MIRHTRKMFLWAALCAPALSGCYQTYSAESITAKVVDAETKQPIEGVIVVANWELKGGLEGGNVEGNVTVMEAVTDATGTFRFPAWGPKTVNVGLSNAELHSSDPGLILFKSGYRFEELDNGLNMKRIRENPTLRTSDWNGKTIAMKKFYGTPKEYAWHVYQSLPSYMFGSHCDWRNVPALLLAIRDQTRIFEEAGIHTGNFYTDLVTNEDFQSTHGCGSVEQFLREHGK